MKVLFLDVDGVLNTNKATTLLSLSRGCLSRLQQVVEVSRCELVLSSIWRITDGSAFGDLPYTKLTRYLGRRNMRICGCTPRLGGIRGEEIAAWLAEHPEVTRYAIVDDDSDMLPEQLPHFFQTDPDYGLTSTIAFRITYHLSFY